MTQAEKYPKWMYIVFPAIAMMLGWGLRGHIGGGPFGAMIPGAMVALCLGLLLELPAVMTSILVVFAVVGIGLGGEMTYGQTLGIIRNPETMWWGALGTTTKGGIWGLLGGIVLSIGFIYKRLSRKNIVITMLLLLAGMLIGFKLINEPMLIYFSDRAKPRSESWAALLMGALVIWFWLRAKVSKEDFRIVSRFALWGLIGGALGFGLGSFWMVLGVNMPQGIVFGAWWKAMEFTFGFLLGGALGYAGWISRKDIRGGISEEDNAALPKISLFKELAMALVAGLLVYWLVPVTVGPLAHSLLESDSTIVKLLGSLSALFVNYAFFGLILIFIALKMPQVAWQMGITLTFCHTMVDLGDDHLMEMFSWSPLLFSALIIIVTTGIVALLTAVLRKREQPLQPLFHLLIWSTVLVSMVKIPMYPPKMELAGKTFCEIVCGLYVVDLFFLVSAIVTSCIVVRTDRRRV